jgi:glycosyltransferase involved in cell wall biosynthesis
MYNEILITLPSLQDQGGVASYYNGVLPHFPKEKVLPLEIGGTKRSCGVIYPVADQIRFRRAVKSSQAALVHLNPSLGFKCLIRDGLFAWQAKHMGLPLLVFWHGWNKEFETVVEKKHLSFFRRTLGQADGHIVLAAEFGQKLQQWGVTVPIYRETTSVAEDLMTGFNAQDKWPEPAQELDEIKILFLARLERAKGVFETVRAVKILVGKKLPVCLTIAGDGDVRRELGKYVQAQGLMPGVVKFTGDIRGDDKIQAFARHHIYCLPSSYGEGLPTSVLEAMAFGMPVVTRPVGGLADIFEDGKMGRLAQGKTPEEIAACIESLIVDQGKMAAIGRYNAAYAKEHFMASKVAGRLLGIYNKMLNAKHNALELE